MSETGQPANKDKIYIKDLGDQGSPAMTPALVVGLLALSLISGFVVGLVVWAILWASFATNVVSFLLPLAFGGSVGPEAGLTGIIAAGCTWIGTRLRKAGIAAKQLADITTAATLSAIFSTPLLGIASAAGPLSQNPEPTYRKGVKVVLYSVAAAGSFAGILLVKQFLGGGMVLPLPKAVQS